MRVFHPKSDEAPQALLKAAGLRRAVGDSSGARQTLIALLQDYPASASAPETVAKKIAASVKALGVNRFDLKYSAGPVPHERLMHCIELYGRKVIPMVRDMVA